MTENDPRKPVGKAFLENIKERSFLFLEKKGARISSEISREFFSRDFFIIFFYKNVFSNF